MTLIDSFVVESSMSAFQLFRIEKLSMILSHALVVRAASMGFSDSLIFSSRYQAQRTIKSTATNMALGSHSLSFYSSTYWPSILTLLATRFVSRRSCFEVQASLPAKRHFLPQRYTERPVSVCLSIPASSCALPSSNKISASTSQCGVDFRCGILPRSARVNSA